MKKFILLTLIASFVTQGAFHSTQARSNKESEKDLVGTQESEPVPEEPVVDSGKIKRIGWKEDVKLSRLTRFLQEGVTTQLNILQLLSAPNVITRSPEEKETWIYHWIWSYQDLPSGETLIQMGHPGLKLKKNNKPVSLVLTFSEQNVLESYVVKLIHDPKEKF